MSAPDLSKTCCSTDRSRSCLTYEQVERLHEVLSEPVQIHAKDGSFPVLAVPPSKLVREVWKKLEKKRIVIHDVRLNGSGASFCLAEDREKDPKPHYNDLDIIFSIEMKSELDFHVIKDEVLNCLFPFLPKGTQTDKISTFLLEESYVKKRVKVSTKSDLWSLISLGDDSGKNIELKFVSSMKRQYEFSVDSFQIILDPLLHLHDSQQDQTAIITQDSYPHIQAISLYEDFLKAMHHLNNRLIATHNPEEIRGGGLLKYCYLLVSGYQHANTQETESQQPYMCSRFFIDFPHMNLQFSKIEKYMHIRFFQQGVPERGLDFLELLMRIVATQAKCLMESERYKTMGVLQHLRAALLWHYGGYYKYQLYQQQVFTPFCHPPAAPPPLPQNNLQCRLSNSSPTYSDHPGNTSTSTESSSTQQPLMNFPHSHNNAVPIGPTPTPVR